MTWRLGISLIKNTLYSLTDWATEFAYIKNIIYSIECFPKTEKPKILIFLPAHILEPIIPNSAKWIEIIKVGTHQDLQKLIDKNPCDLYFTFGKIPEFITTRPIINCIPDFGYQSLPDAEKHPKELSINFILESSDAIICHQISLPNQFQHQNKLISFPFKCHLSSTEISEDPKKVLQKFKLNNKYIYLPSDFKKNKNIKTIFTAWNELKSMGYDYQLVCSGKFIDATYFQEQRRYQLKNHLTDHIRILNFVTPAEEFQLIRNCAAFLLSHFDWNISQFQAAALGKIVLKPQALLNDETHYLFSEKDPLQLAELIHNNWENFSFPYDQEKENHMIATHQCELEKFTQNMLQVFNKTLSANKTSNNHTHELVLTLNKELLHTQQKLDMSQDELNTRYTDSEKKILVVDELNKKISQTKNDIVNIQEQYNSLYQEKSQMIDEYKQNIDFYETTINELQIQEHLESTSLMNYLNIQYNNINHVMRKIIDEHVKMNLANLRIVEKYQQLCMQNDKTIAAQQDLLQEKEITIFKLQERFESLVYHQGYLIELFKYGKFIYLLKRLFFKTKRITKKFFTPQLGKLFQYSPKILHVPNYYYKNKKSKKTLPKISITTPSFNQGKFIERTIKSVLDQNYPHLELIIQDGNSSDESVEIIKKYESSLKHWASQKDTGQGNAINLGFQHATGDIMAYLNSDDLLMPGSLHYVGHFFNEHPDVDVVYGHRILINEEDKEIGRWVLPHHNSSILSFVDYIPQETLFWRRSIWERAGSQIDENFRFAMDWDLLVRFREAGARFSRLPRFLGAFRVHRQQKTSAAIDDVGLLEMNKIRQRLHNRYVSFEEVNQKIGRYLKWHFFYNKLYQAGLLRY